MFLHAMVDVARYDRQFGNCGAKVKDLTSHGLQKCPMVEHLCRIFEITMGLYNAPDELDMRNKSQVMREALVKKSLLNAVFLVVLSNWEE